MPECLEHRLRVAESLGSEEGFEPNRLTIEQSQGWRSLKISGIATVGPSTIGPFRQLTDYIFADDDWLCVCDLSGEQICMSMASLVKADLILLLRPSADP